ncbi:zona pellucida sperm-binding protein 3-like [Neoarius graeffei]|uniref:zona pellucida sperm-binding protein 3-like n=1 Tax=Neoarius graeffei TaxID=443677 RepID=UPI00298C659C|nr:zona pellucida sperm-binding protein 3-like [Neoarius graeffei]
MEVHVKADLFDLGVPVNPEHLTLGERCGVTENSSEEFILHAALMDCGTRYLLTADALIYTNVLVYTPVPSVHGVSRYEKTSVPVECVYRRRVGVDGVSVVPMWLPHLSSHAAEHSLRFTLQLMTTDWLAVRSGVYYLGDMINIEASVFVPLLELQVFVQDCVATMTPDANSVPRYKFIQDGCFTDGQQMGSMSHFLARTQPDKLHLQLQTFIFRQVHSAQIFISCSLKADLRSSSSSRACSYIRGSWRSADGEDAVCESCQMLEQFRQKQKVGEGQNEAQAASVQMELGEPELRTSGSMSLLQDVQVGPLALSSLSDASPPAVLEGVHISRVPLLEAKRLMARMLQGNLSMLGSEYDTAITEKDEQESHVSAEQEMGVSLMPELQLTVTPLTIPEKSNGV